MTVQVKKLFFILCLVFAAHTVARAETITLTSGGFTSTPSGTFITGTVFGRFAATGPNSSLSGFFVGATGLSPCPFCRPGDTIELGNSFDSFYGSSLTNPTLINGVTYNLPDYEFNFRTAMTPVVVPFFHQSTGFVATAPFSFSPGSGLVGCLGGSACGDQAFRVGVEGVGTITLVADRVPSNVAPVIYLARSITYQLGTPPASVTVTPLPEPTTIMLLGGGLAGVVLRARRKKK